MLALITLLPLAKVVNAHVALWDKGLFGLNWPGQASDSNQNYNTNEVVNPLRQDMNLNTDQWFGHGMKSYPPADGNFMELESGGTYVGELQCNRGQTTLGDPRSLPGALNYQACGGTGALHVLNTFGQPTVDHWFGGTALAIAYTSDVNGLQPSDMTVISINATSPWVRETNYPIPAGLPSCPSGGCLCSWNWIHENNHGEGYGPEIYSTIYRCTVSGQTNDNNKLALGGGAVPTYCENSPSTCVTGPKQPMYIWQASGNNMPQPWPDVNPTYNLRYGYKDGAQTDLFATTAGGGSTPTVHTTSQVPNTSPASSAIASSSAVTVPSTSMAAGGSSQTSSTISTAISSSAVSPSAHVCRRNLQSRSRVRRVLRRRT